MSPTTCRRRIGTDTSGLPTIGQTAQRWGVPRHSLRLQREIEHQDEERQAAELARRGATALPCHAAWT